MVLEVVQGYKLEFVRQPFQTSIPNPLHFSEKDELVIDNEICELRAKNAVRVVMPTPGEFISTLFLVPKIDGGCQPVINLREVNQF